MQDQIVAAKIQLTQEGLDELQAELSELLEVKLPAAIERVSRAREYGDLAENAEYHDAREQQNLLEARIEEIQSIIAKAEVVSNTRSVSKVGMGSTVAIQVKGKKAKMTVVIVGEFEAVPGENKISSVSPLGKALMGAKKGDVVKVTAPAGEIEYEVLEIK